MKSFSSSHLNFRPEKTYSSVIITTQDDAECSSACIQLAHFLVEEATGIQPYPPPGLIQNWVRSNLEFYAPDFVRTLTIIPLELIPPASHVLNIDRQIEGRMVAIDVHANKATFKLDGTSLRKLEVFHAELTGSTSAYGLTEKLEALRIRMAISTVVGSDLLTFQDVLGGLFVVRNSENDGSSNLCNEDPIAVDAQIEWAEFCQSLYEEHCGRFSPDSRGQKDNTLMDLSPGCYCDADHLDAFAEHYSSNPCLYCGHVPSYPLHSSHPSPGRQANVSAGLSKKSLDITAQFQAYLAVFSALNGHKLSKSYGVLDYGPIKALRVPKTPPLTSMADPPSPSVLILPDPYVGDVLTDMSSEENLHRQCLISGTGTPTNFPSLSFHQSSVHSPFLLDNSTRLYRYSEATTASSSASTSSHPSIYDAFPISSTVTNAPVIDVADARVTRSLPLWSENDGYISLAESPEEVEEITGDHQRRLFTRMPEEANEETLWCGFNDQQMFAGLRRSDQSCEASQTQHSTPRDAYHEEELNEYSFELEEEANLPPHRMKEKEGDPVEAIIQDKMKAMLEAAQLDGCIYKATRDGVDNHPISCPKEPMIQSTISKQSKGTAETESHDVDPENEICSSSLRWNRYLPATRNEYSAFKSKSRLCQLSVDDGCESSKGKYGEEKLTIAKRTTDLRALRHRFEVEGEQILGALRRTIERIHILDASIRRAEERELKLLKNETREMLECCGYDENVFTAESPTDTCAKAVLEKLKPTAYDGTSENSLPLSMEHLDERIIQYGIQSKLSHKDSIYVNTSLENCIQHTEDSPCCQIGTINEKDSQAATVRCAHGLLRNLKPLPQNTNPSDEILEGTHFWELNYAIKGRRGKWHKDHIGSNIDTQTDKTITSGGSALLPSRTAFSGTGVPQPLKQVLPNIAIDESNHAVPSGGWDTQTDMDKHASAWEKYLEEVKYVSTAHVSSKPTGNLDVDLEGSGQPPTVKEDQHFFDNDSLCAPRRKNWIGTRRNGTLALRLTTHASSCCC